MSDCIVIAGTREPIEVGYDITVRRTGGSEFIRTWHGTGEAIANKIAELAGSGAQEVRAVHQQNSAIATVSARYSGTPTDGRTESVEETLTIAYNDTPIELHRHPQFVDISSSRIKALDDAAEVNNSSVPSAGAELAYWTYKLRGVETYRVKLPVLTYTVTGSRSMGLDLAASDAGLIFSTSQVSARVGKPIKFTIPSSVIGVSAGSVGTFVEGWMLDPRVELMANGNVQLVEVYEFGLWEVAADPGDGFNLYVSA